LGQGLEGGAPLGRIGGGSQEDLQFEEAGTGSGDLVQEEIVGAAVDLGVHLAGSQGEGQALATDLELGQVVTEGGDLLMELGGVVGDHQGGIEGGGGGQAGQEGGDVFDDTVFADVVGVAGLAGVGAVGVFGAP